ncbi:phage portal protein%2C putative%2C A118 family [uncultured Roseburia sp.]|nr:phage portal protein%2C putative%2C A118 family [uncultured Roseburia sp.]
MFGQIVSFVKGVIRNMFPAKNIKQALQVETCMSETMQQKLELWSCMYQGRAPWCRGPVKSLRKEQGICREFSNVCLNEMESRVSVEALDNIYQASIRDLNEHLQSGIALGSFIIKPLGGDKVEYVTAGQFVPIEYDARRRLVDVVFVQIKRLQENGFYYRLERHAFKEGVLKITNRAFHSHSETVIGREIPLTEVEEWAALPEAVEYHGLEKPDFGYYRNPIKNEVDGSPCGVSVFDSAIEQLKHADIQGARLDWEFESGERAINVDAAALRAVPEISNGKTRLVLPKLNERLYRGLNLEAGTDKELYQEWSPEFRDVSIVNGLNTYLRQVEFNVSLSYGDLSDVSDVDKTATEARIARKRKYNMVQAMQMNLKECLEDLVYALAFYNAMTKSGYEFLCTFKDSILVDEETERQQDRSDVSMGAMLLWEYRMKWYGETEEQAKAAVQQLCR